MKQLVTQGIVLQRTDYLEADRILVLLTPDQGKLHVLAKGVRKVKSKLAGGIELFSVSQITYIKGRSDLGTLVSSRLVKHYGGIVKDINRTMMGYELIKLLNKSTEDEPEEDYFAILQGAFEALEDASIELPLIQAWFTMQLLRVAGHTPNLQTDVAGNKLDVAARYNFSFDDMAFTAGATQSTYDYNEFSGSSAVGESSGRYAPANIGRFSANHIKFLRLGFSGYPAKGLAHVQGSDGLVAELTPLVNTMRQAFLRQ
jgi:DNA repair protein RecO (recombination protein O)